MADHTKIEWTEATWNPITGCSVYSAGCTNCYAMKLAGTRLRHHPSRAGLTIDTKAGPVWNGQVRFNEDWLTQPLQWKRPRMIFVCAHADLFHEAVPDEWIDRIFAVMALCPQHTFQVLTKRSDRMRAYMHGFTCDGARRFNVADAAGRMMEDGDGAWSTVAANTDWPLPNVWLGVSVENQATADERIPDLLATPAAVRWLSCEPLLGPVDFNEVPAERGRASRPIFGPLSGYCRRHFPRYDCKCSDQRPKIDWVVVGGESGNDARPMHPDWARSLRDQCEAAGTPFFFKQWGNWAPGEIAGEHLDPEKAAKGASFYNDRWHDCWSEPEMHVDDEPDVYRVGKKAAGRQLDGKLHDGMPEVHNV
ncbi:phage Gp37/Gp68 family protein [Sphingorhabdus pulchriflava]|uniref:Phage Gp37/Gp68 family protein n=1 Tax=Sphingorhabdus pulchriflava TaxID=2292257 RepID=A0A371BFL5_9SPHN|nr:phage Gp37/Gp68 family protein [Sphingorhabdus pulchriflava]RDV06392.1 phage Gp37/Gp68 family protein [Sphingorhabdus pulchriflava]